MIFVYCNREMRNNFSKCGEMRKVREATFASEYGMATSGNKRETKWTDVQNAQKSAKVAPMPKYV